MSRPLRIQYPDAWYHVMNRGRRGESVFHNGTDYLGFIELLKESVEMWQVRIAAYCLMPNHYNLLVQTPEANLSRCMRHINGVYTQRFNRSHSCDGQLFRGRYKCILVDADSYVGLPPSLWLFEGETVSMDPWAASSAVGARFSIQNPVTPQTGEGSTWLILQRAQELMVAVLAVAHDEMGLFGHLCAPVATQLLDLLHAYFNSSLLAGDPPNGNGGSPTTTALRYPDKHGVGMSHHDGAAVDS